jgi:hypothetical protein
MEKLSFVLSLVDRNNDYQRAQAAAAEDAAHRMGVDLQILFGGGNAVEQSQQTAAIRNNTRPKELTVIDALSYPQIDRLVPLMSRAASR